MAHHRLLSAPSPRLQELRRLFGYWESDPACNSGSEQPACFGVQLQADAKIYSPLAFTRAVWVPCPLSAPLTCGQQIPAPRLCIDGGTHLFPSGRRPPGLNVHAVFGTQPYAAATPAQYKIWEHASEFCTFDDYNWDMSLMSLWARRLVPQVMVPTTPPALALLPPTRSKTVLLAVAQSRWCESWGLPWADCAHLFLTQVRPKYARVEHAG